MVERRRQGHREPKERQWGVYDTKKLIERERRKLSDPKSKIPKDVQTTIKSFIDDMRLKENIGEHRQLFYLTKLRVIYRWMGDSFLEPDENDIKRAVERINKDYDKPNTRDDYKVAVKRFYRWLIGKDKVVPEFVQWIKLSSANEHKKEKPEKIISPDEYKKLLDACLKPRDKALLALLYDSGCRISELLTLRIGDIEFDKYGAILSVSGKTGSRRVRVIGDSVGLMHQWLALHPSKSKDSYMFTLAVNRNSPDEKERGYPLNYDAFSRILKKTAIRAKLGRSIHAHLFRHTRATILARDVAESPLEDQMGWQHGSHQTKTYVHLAGKDVDAAILKAYGISIEEEKKHHELPIQCPRCRTVNVTGAQFCSQCSLPLSDKAAQDFEDLEKLMRLLYADHIADTQINYLLDAGVLKFNVDKNLKMLDDPEVQHMLKILRKKTDGAAES